MDEPRRRRLGRRRQLGQRRPDRLVRRLRHARDACVTLDGTYTVAVAGFTVNRLTLGTAANTGVQTLVLTADVAVPAGGTVAPSGDLEWRNGYLTAGTLTNTGLVSLAAGGGTLFLASAAFFIEGEVSPGTEAEPVATLDVLGRLYFSRLAGDPRLVVDVDAGGQSDRIVFTNTPGSGLAVQPNATLVIRVRPGYTPQIGDTFTILTSNAANRIQGAFTQVVAQDAPPGIAFVAEYDNTAPSSITVRAVAVAPGGAIAVADDTPVGGGVRTLFLTGPGVPGISSARLDCTDCLDAAAFGSIPATLVGEGTLREARVDLTDSRAFGLYDLVIQRPGQPDAVVPVTVRPYLSSVSAEARSQNGMRIRPATAPGQLHNYSRYVFSNLTNGPAAFPFVQIDRPDRSAMILASRHTRSGNRFYDSDTAPDPLTLPLLASAVPPNDSSTDFEIGLRLDPADVLFPGQTPTGPDDVRFPFGEGQHMFFLATNNTTLERAARAVREAITGTGRSDLDGYLASVAAADPDALGVAIGAALQPAPRSLALSPILFAAALDRLGATVPVPSGLSTDAAPAFRTALLTAIDGLSDREAAAATDALAATGAVRTLYLDELAALGLTLDDEPRAASGGTVSTACRAALRIHDAAGIRAGCPCEQIRSYNRRENLQLACPPPSGSVDPNDKTADTDLLCEFGTVTIDGEPETRCVRYFVPRARATEPVAYTIAFENLPAATAAAEFVTITDEIDPNLNLASLQVESTSSDSTFSYTVSGRTVTFRFVGIDLPPNRTAPEGEGFVRFTLRPNAGLPDGTEIRNDASIVFDFNPAIATPEVLHEIRTVSDVATLITAPDYIIIGSPLEVGVTVANLRGDASEETAVTIQTGGLTGVTATATVGECAGAGPVTCAFGTLAPGAVAEVTLTSASAPLGLYTLTAATSTTSFDGFAANDTDQREVGVASVGGEGGPDDLRELTLAAPRPNPVRGAATLRWGLPAPARIDVRVYDLLGREVAVIARDEPAEAGWHETRLDAGSLASGVYVVRIQSGTEARTRRIVVIR